MIMKIAWKPLIILVLGAWCLGIARGAPLHPALPYPIDLATNVPANVDLTWTPGDPELVRNGGFESGNFTSWTRANDSPFPGTTTNNTYINNGTYIPQSGDGPYPPYAGGYSAVTDQNAPGSISIYQDVLVPASVGSVWLTWADRIHNYAPAFVPEPPQPQVYRVEVRAANNSALLALAYRTEEGDPVRTGWTKRSFDVTPFKGRTLRLVFVEEQWRSLFNVYWDNISLRVRDTGPVTYDVFFGTNSVPGTNEYRGNVSTGNWPLPQLLPGTTYFWRVNARFGADLFTGPVWRFTTAPVRGLDHFGWTVQPDRNATLTARDAAGNLVTNFSGSANLTAFTIDGDATNNLLGNIAPSVFAGFERATVGYSFTPDTDMLAIGVRHFSGDKVSLWTEDGVLLGSQVVQSQTGTWQETALSPIQLLAGRTYRVGVYSQGYTSNYLRLDGLSTFAHGTLGEAYEGPGDACPLDPHPARWWLVDIIYTIPALSPAAVSPAQVNFVNGLWNGLLELNANGLVLLRAEDGAGHAGITRYTLANLQLQIFKTLSGAAVRFATQAGKTYVLESSTDLSEWLPFGASFPGTGGVIQQPLDTSVGHEFFRVKASN